MGEEGASRELTDLKHIIVSQAMFVRDYKPACRIAASVLISMVHSAWYALLLVDRKYIHEPITIRAFFNTRRVYDSHYYCPAHLRYILAAPHDK